MKSKYYYYLYFFSLLVVFSCDNQKKKIELPNPFFKISLAQWSLNKMVKNGANPLDFPKEAKDLGFNAVELVGLREIMMQKQYDKIDEYEKVWRLNHKIPDGHPSTLKS